MLLSLFGKIYKLSSQAYTSLTLRQQLLSNRVEVQYHYTLIELTSDSEDGTQQLPVPGNLTYIC